jgi:hypothetical protein
MAARTFKMLAARRYQMYKFGSCAHFSFALRAFQYGCAHIPFDQRAFSPCDARILVRFRAKIPEFETRILVFYAQDKFRAFHCPRNAHARTLVLVIPPKINNQHKTNTK